MRGLPYLLCFWKITSVTQISIESLKVKVLAEKLITNIFILY